MKAEYINDLLLGKFYSSSKEQQKKLLRKLLPTHTSQQETVIDILNDKPVYQHDKHFSEGDLIYITLDTNCYPRINEKYYIDNALVLNDTYIRVKVLEINPFSNYITLSIIIENLTIESPVNIWYNNIPDQQEIILL